MNEVTARILARCISPARPPYIAVLGPPGCGKTSLIRSVYRKLRDQRFTTQITPFFLNLRNIALGSEVEMQDQLNAELVREMQALDFATEAPLFSRPGVSTSDLLQDLCKASKGRVVIFIDQFDSVPNFFSRCLSRQIRALYEKSELDDTVKRLGVVVAGVLSIFNLKRETDSAFAYFSTEALPPNLLSERISAVADQLPRGLKLAPDLLKWLADYCGPDPAFLKHLVDEIKSHGSATTRVIKKRLKSHIKKGPASGQSVLRDIAIQMWIDPYLFEIVGQLAEGTSPVAIHEPIVDVPLFQLLGVSRVEDDCYVFRNEIVRDYATSVHRTLHQCAPSLTAQQIMRIQTDRAHVPGIDDVLMLDSCRRALEQSSSIADVKRVLLAIWRVLRQSEEPEIRIAVDIEGDPPVEHEELDGAAGRALNAGRRLHRTTFGWDHGRICICVPTVVAHATAFVLATLERTRLQADFSESALRVWIRMIEGSRAPIFTHAILEQAVVSRVPKAELLPNPVAAFNDNTAATPSDSIGTVEEVLVELAFERLDPNEFVHDLIERAHLPKALRIAALRLVNGSPDVTIRRILRWALDTDRSPDDPETPVLLRMISSILDEIGLQQRRLLLSALLQLPTGITSGIELMATQFDVPFPAVGVALGGNVPVAHDLEPEWSLQAFLRKDDDFLDVGVLKKALERSPAVCMISFPEAGRFGSGVLVHQDLIITNYHVVSPNDNIGQEVSKAIVQLGFTSDASGTKCELHPKALVSSSPTTKLDYAILRLARAYKSGVDLTPSKERKPKSPVHILQHPGGESMKLSLSRNGLVSVDTQSGKIKYVTATAGGSSGAPCFDEDWNLIAIHRAEKATAFGSVREGVLVDAIVADAGL